MQITFDTNDLTLEDRALIAAAIGITTAYVEELPAPAAPAKKAAPSKPAKAAKAKAEPVAEEEDDEDVEEEQEDVEDEAEDEDDDEPTGNTLDDAIAKATELVAAGQSAKVKAALAKVGVRKVSELKPASISKFIAALG